MRLVSLGDLILDVIAAKGEVLFHGIAVKPGKPTAFGIVDGKLVFGMPGYPTSCLSNAYVLLVPFLRAVRTRERPEMTMVFSLYRDSAGLAPMALFSLLLTFFDLSAVYAAVAVGWFVCAWQIGRAHV